LHFDLEWSWRNLSEDVGEEQKWQHFVVGEVGSSNEWKRSAQK